MLFWKRWSCRSTPILRSPLQNDKRSSGGACSEEDRSRLSAAATTIVTTKPTVSAIIVNWNGAHHLTICLPSLRSQTLASLEIIVVDNGSQDDSAEVTREFQARWLPLGKNVGLAPGLNRGAEIATGDFLLFINNDMRFDPGFVAALVEPLKQDEKIFASDGMQFNWDGSERGHLATRLAKRRPSGHSSTELVPGLYFYQREEPEKSPVFMGSAACMLVRRRLFEELGRFDERLPLGYEDVEICWRAWMRGWKTVYVPEAVCWHRVGSSGRSLEGMRMNFRGILRGRLLLATKLLPLRYVASTWLVTIAALTRDISRLRWVFAKDRIKVLFQTAGLVPQLLREKRVLFKESGITSEGQLNLLLQLSDRESAGGPMVARGS
jgi:N-acetylglucosaminyl-diphospho-decaprenol L-rhamnosyltransferase